MEQILLECTGDGTLSLTATNLVTYATATIPHEGPVVSGAILPKFLKAAMGIANSTGEPVIELEMGAPDNETNPNPEAPIVLRLGKWSIPAARRPKNEYPMPPKSKGNPTGIDGKFFDALKHTLPFTSTDETRYIITGIFLDPESELEGIRGHAVATDGRRITASACEVPFEGILPKTAAALIAGSDANSGTAHRSNDPDPIAVFDLTTPWGNLNITTKLLAGNYPHWPQVIPAGTPTGKRRWDTANLLAEIDPILILGEKARLEITREGTNIKLDGSNTAGFTKTIQTDKEISCAMNLTFVKSLCALFRQGAEVLHFPDQQPLRVKQNGVTHAVMPMRWP